MSGRVLIVSPGRLADKTLELRTLMAAVVAEYAAVLMLPESEVSKAIEALTPEDAGKWQAEVAKLTLLRTEEPEEFFFQKQDFKSRAYPNQPFYARFRKDRRRR